MTPLQKIIADLQDLMARPVNDGELPFPDAVDAIRTAHAAGFREGVEASAKVADKVECRQDDDPTPTMIKEVAYVMGRELARAIRALAGKETP